MTDVGTPMVVNFIRGGNCIRICPCVDAKDQRFWLVIDDNNGLKSAGLQLTAGQAKAVAASLIEAADRMNPEAPETNFIGLYGYFP